MLWELKWLLSKSPWRDLWNWHVAVEWQSQDEALRTCARMVMTVMMLLPLLLLLLLLLMMMTDD